MSERREQDERAARRIEGEVAATAEELARRVERWTNVKGQLAKRKTPILVTGGTIVALGLGFLVYRIATRDRRHRKEFGEAFRRVQRHPERLATGRKIEPWPQAIGKRLATAALGAFVAQGAKRFAQRTVPA